MTTRPTSKGKTGATPKAAGLRRVAFSLLMLLGIVVFVEALSAATWFLIIAKARRVVVETAVGLRNPGANSVLRYRPHPYLNYIGHPDYIGTDGVRLHHPLGFRATEVDPRHKRPGVFRVVALGGSTTFGAYVTNPRHVWPELVGLALEKTFGPSFDVINAGVPNYTTYELLGLAALWLPEFDADLVLVHTGLNDAFSVGFPDEGGPDNTSFRHSWTHRELPQVLRVAMRASYFARLLGHRWVERGGFAGGDMTPAMQYPIPDPDDVRRHAATATGRYYRRNLETLVTLIRHAGAEPVLVNMPLNPRYETMDSVYYQAVSDTVLRNNRIMKDVGEKSNVLVVELHARMRDATVYKDAGHVDERGMMQKAQGVFDAIRPMVERYLADAM